jgi:hypothetical protein
MFTTDNKSAAEFYKKACSAEEQSELELAEVYYLKSGYAFEQAGKADYLNAVNAFNALALLRAARGNQKGALAAANKAAQIMENYSEQTLRRGAKLICTRTQDPLTSLISFESGCGTPIAQAG